MRITLPQLLLYGGLLLTLAAAADYRWYPVPVNTGPLTATSRPRLNYEPLPRARQPWRLCAVLPHLKDNYWLAVNYGLVAEARRQGVRIQVYFGPGYTAVEPQLAQLRDCVSGGADALLIAAVHPRALNAELAQLHARGLKLIDLANGIDSPHIDARSLVAYDSLAALAGRYLVKRHHDTAEPVPVAWFPGPRHAQWAEAADRGFRAALAGTPIHIVASYYGDTGLDSQRRLVEQALREHPEVRYLVGTAVTAEAATRLLHPQARPKPPGIISYYFSAAVYDGLRRGSLLAAGTDAPVLQARIAVDQAVRLLENEPVHRVVSPQLQLITPDTIHRLDRLGSLAPSGFHITLDVP